MGPVYRRSALTAGALAALATAAWTPALAGVQHPDFFTSYATQSGQNYHGRRPPWTVAGVDEPEGYREQYVPLLDPASLNGQQGCLYSEVGPRLICNNSAGVTIRGYDFSLHGGVFLQLASASGPCVVQDSNFQWVAKNAFNPYYMVIFGSCASYTFNYNTMKWNPTGTYPNPFWEALVLVYPSGTSAPGNFEHNDVEWTNGRFVSFGSSGAYTLRYNYLEGMAYTGAKHGENELAGASSNYDAEFNTVLIPASTPIPANTATFAPVIGYGTGAMPLVTVSNNVVVINKAGGAGGKFANGYALYAVQNAEHSVGILNINNNWIDPSGAYFCSNSIGSAIGAFNETGNVNLLDGSSVTGIRGLREGEVCHHM